MNEQYFTLMQKGVPGELELLPTSQKLAQFKIARDLFLFEQDLAVAYINALIQNNAYMENHDTRMAFSTCIRQAHNALPLNLNLLSLYSVAFGTTISERVTQILEAVTFNDAEDSQIRRLAPQQQYDHLLSILSQNPSHMGAADALLNLSAKENFPITDWLDTVKCPGKLKLLWQQRLFLYYARLGLSEPALKLWRELPNDAKNPLNTVYAANNFAIAGDEDAAIAHYSMALKKDPLMGPVQRRLQELLSPQKVNTLLTSEKHTSICVYSWNKGEVLEQTLRSLAQTELGNYKLFVLLNGCTDDSRERMLQVQPLFGDRFNLIELPVNIGAPAARNWLINMSEVQQSDFIAFLDDDIILQKDWLNRMLTDMEQDKQIGVAGCRVVNPSSDARPPLLQYIYRMVDFVHEGILKLSPATPTMGLRDTGLYTFRRECQNVMGCQHVFRTSILKEVGGFDIRFSPSQVDDIDHDLSICLKGYKVWYCGTVQCQHLQGSGVSASKSNTGLSYASLGSILGNDLKLCFKHFESMHKLHSQAIEISTF